MKSLLFTVLILCCSLSSNAGEVVLSDSVKDINITHKIKIFETENDNEIPSFIAQTDSGIEEINRNYSSNTLWLNFSLHNDSQIVRHFTLYFLAPLTGRVELFEVKDGTPIKVQTSGSAVPVTKRASKHLRAAFPILLKADQKKEFIIKLKTHHLLYSEVRIAKESEYITSENKVLLVFIFYLGVFLALILYNLFFYIKLSDPLYFIYCAFSFMVMICFCIVNGVADYLLNFENFTLTYYLMSFSSAAGLSALIFTYYFLNLKNSPKWLKVINNSIALILIFHLIVGVLSGSSNLVIKFGTTVDFAIFVTLLWMIFLSVRSYLVGQQMGKWLTFSWIVLGVFVTGWFLMNYGFIDHNVWTQNLLLWGHLVEMCIITFALASRFSILATDAHFREVYSEEKTQYQNLYRLLMHDVGNFVQIMSLRLMRKDNDKRVSEDNDTEKIYLEKLNNRINQVLELAKAQEGLILSKQNLGLEKVDLGSCVREAIQLFNSDLEIKSIGVNVNLVDEPIYVLAEEKSLVNEVFVNILKNAIKFSPESSEVTITAVKTNISVDVMVADQGVGLTSAQLDKFEKEGVINSTEGESGEKGTGLGLSIILSFMRMYGGDFKLLSKGKNLGTMALLTFKNNVNH